MKIFFSIIFATFFLFTSCNTAKKAQKKQIEYDLSMYPKSNDSIKRFVIELPSKENEDLFHVEVWAGQTKKVDCNTHIILGEFTKKTVKGWGYSYYEFTTNGNQISTRMACPENTLTEKFIRSKTESVRYNSKLPIVVFCPANFEVAYAIWSKNETSYKAKLK